MIAPTFTTASEVLNKLLERGYTLSVRTRVEETAQKVGMHFTTHADKLHIEGPEPLPDDLRAQIIEHRDELLAAACLISPPVPWIAELVRRCRDGYTMKTSRLMPYRKRDGTVGRKTTPVTVSMIPETVASNVASFIGLHPAHDQERLLPIIRETLR